MPYEMHVWLRKLIMAAENKSCSTCRHYERHFGDDTCFGCLCHVKAVGYERRKT